MNTTTFIYQPNRITEAEYNGTLIQERTLTAIIYLLQEYIEPQIAQKKAFKDLKLFNKQDPVIKLKIPLNHIGKPNQYDRIRESIIRLAGVVVNIKVKSNDGTEMVRYTSMLSANIPCDSKRNSYVIVEIERKVAHRLIQIDLNTSNKAAHFTRFGYEVCQKLKGKYSSRLYKLLSSYHKKGEFEISIERLKRILGISNKYKRYTDFKSKVLLPAQKELKENAKLWYDCEQSDFLKKSNGIPSTLSFYIYSEKLNEGRNIQRDNNIALLKMHFGFKDADIEEIRNVLNNPRNNLKFSLMLTRINEYLAKSDQYVDKVKYVKKSILDGF